MLIHCRMLSFINTLSCTLSHGNETNYTNRQTMRKQLHSSNEFAFTENLILHTLDQFYVHDPFTSVFFFH